MRERKHWGLFERRGASTTLALPSLSLIGSPEGVAKSFKWFDHVRSSFPSSRRRSLASSPWTCFDRLGPYRRHQFASFLTPIGFELPRKGSNCAEQTTTSTVCNPDKVLDERRNQYGRASAGICSNAISECGAEHGRNRTNGGYQHTVVAGPQCTDVATPSECPDMKLGRRRKSAAFSSDHFGTACSS